MHQPLTSIVILTRNELEYTQQCVASIQRHTPEPFEFVFVDNGSSDGTADWLRTVPGATVLANEHNAGFGGGCNQGMASATGERILLLNNDIVVTAGWLTALHRELDLAGDVGIAGPRSNHVAGDQLVQQVGYDVETLDGLEAFASEWTNTRSGTGYETQRLIGLCMLFRRETLEQIGGFDLRYGIGNFEDDDICLRAAIAGWRQRVAHDSYVHHYGSRTFIGQRVDYASTMRTNFRRFAERWSLRPDERLANGGYDNASVIRRTSFDALAHFAPFSSARTTDVTVEFESRGRSLLVCCNRFDEQSNREMLVGVVDAVGPTDDVTVVVRIDPRDTTSLGALEQAADEAGDATPDIVLIDLPDDDDVPAIRACDAVLVHGPGAWTRSATARWAGSTPVTLVDLAHDIAWPARAAAA